jgi:hypothetical protein
VTAVHPAVRTVRVCWIDGDPPPRGQVDYIDHAAYAAVLRSRPGRYAKLPDLPASAVPGIVQGTVSAYRPAGAYIAMVRNGVVYAAYIGDGP